MTCPSGFMSIPMLTETKVAPAAWWRRSTPTSASGWSGRQAWASQTRAVRCTLSAASAGEVGFARGASFMPAIRQRHPGRGNPARDAADVDRLVLVDLPRGLVAEVLAGHLAVR